MTTMLHRSKKPNDRGAAAMVVVTEAVKEGIGLFGRSLSNSSARSTKSLTS
jgi:hypothetical protein